MYRFGSHLFAFGLCLAMFGCSGPEDLSVTKGPNTTPSNTTTPTNSVPSSENAPEILLEPYDAPPLEELEAKITWVDQRVEDTRKLLAEHLAKSKPLTDVQTALSLKNNFPKSKINNEKIKTTLGRLPENDSQVDYDAMITRHVGGDAKSLNPLMASSATEFDMSSLLGVSLFTFDWEMNAMADADFVKSWQTSDDMIYDKVTLRDDLYWDDGKQITAHDIVFSFKTILNPKIIIPAVRSGTDEIRWIEAYDDHTFVVTHKKPSPTNVWNINFPVIPKHAYEHTIDADPTMRQSKEHTALEKDPIEGGPYRLVKRVRNQEIVFERREEFFMVNGKQVRDKPFFKSIRFRVIEDPNTAIIALKSGEIEEMAISAEHWDSQANDEEFYKLNTKATSTEWVSFHFCWNCENPLFRDKNVRKALGFAFDHEEMLNKTFKDLYSPSNGPFHPKSWMSPKPAPPYLSQDLDKAEDLLDEAGWDDSDFDGIRDNMINGRKVNFEFTIITSQSPNSIKVCTLLKESLDRIGIICHVKPMEYTVLQQKNLDGDFQATMGGWGTGTDPSTNKNIFGTGANRNYGKYSNAKVDDLFEQGMQEFDKDKRAEIYGEIHKQLYEDQPYTWLFYRNSFYGFNKKLRGYQFSPRGPFHYSPGFFSIWAATGP
ncbi:MAG: ABC transporter substrate-binding protein [Pirellulales bacterium]